jgi:hypothetical protein
MVRKHFYLQDNQWTIMVKKQLRNSKNTYNKVKNSLHLLYLLYKCNFNKTNKIFRIKIKVKLIKMVYLINKENLK